MKAFKIKLKMYFMKYLIHIIIFKKKCYLKERFS